jgi:hypothetical protein
MYNALAKNINGVQDTANAILSGIDKLLKAAEVSADSVKDLKGETNSILSKLGQVTSVADKIANTTQSYRDVLVAGQELTPRSLETWTEGPSKS